MTTAEALEAVGELLDGLVLERLIEFEAHGLDAEAWAALLAPELAVWRFTVLERVAEALKDFDRPFTIH